MPNVADYLAILTGGWWEVDGVSPPSTPTLSVVDNLTGSSVTATVDGEAGVTNRLYYCKAGDSTLTAGSSRSGDGTITQTGLTQDNVYYFVAVSISGVTYSLPSKPVILVVRGSGSTGIQAALYYTLSNDAGIVAEVGTNVFQSGDVKQDNATKYIVVQRIDEPEERYQGGASSLYRAHFQTTCVAATQKAAKDIADAVKTCLNDFRGTMGTGANTCTVKRVAFESERDISSGPIDGTQRGPQVVFQDWIIWHTG
jgi:hypothetical protein